MFTEILKQRVLSGVRVVPLPWAIRALRRRWEPPCVLGCTETFPLCREGSKQSNKR